MKVIDLLNKIANGEEVPKKIKYEDTIYNFVNSYNDFYEFQDLGYQTDTCAWLNIWRENLNDEVEIIEEPKEHKIPEKLNISNFPRHNNSLKKTAIKVNEILDYLEKIK